MNRKNSISSPNLKRISSFTTSEVKFVKLSQRITPPLKDVFEKFIVEDEGITYLTDIGSEYKKQRVQTSNSDRAKVAEDKRVVIKRRIIKNAPESDLSKHFKVKSTIAEEQIQDYQSKVEIIEQIDQREFGQILMKTSDAQLFGFEQNQQKKDFGVNEIPPDMTRAELDQWKINQVNLHQCVFKYLEIQLSGLIKPLFICTYQGIINNQVFSYADPKAKFKMFLSRHTFTPNIFNCEEVFQKRTVVKFSEQGDQNQFNSRAVYLAIFCSQKTTIQIKLQFGTQFKHVVREEVQVIEKPVLSELMQRKQYQHIMEQRRLQLKDKYEVNVIEKNLDLKFHQPAVKEQMRNLTRIQSADRINIVLIRKTQLDEQKRNDTYLKFDHGERVKVLREILRSYNKIEEIIDTQQRTWLTIFKLAVIAKGIKRLYYIRLHELIEENYQKRINQRVILVLRQYRANIKRKSFVDLSLSMRLFAGYTKKLVKNRAATLVFKFLKTFGVVGGINRRVHSLLAQVNKFKENYRNFKRRSRCYTDRIQKLFCRNWVVLYQDIKNEDIMNLKEILKTQDKQKSSMNFKDELNKKIPFLDTKVQNAVIIRYHESQKVNYREKYRVNSNMRKKLMATSFSNRSSVKLTDVNVNAMQSMGSDIQSLKSIKLFDPVNMVLLRQEPTRQLKIIKIYSCLEILIIIINIMPRSNTSHHSDKQNFNPTILNINDLVLSLNDLFPFVVDFREQIEQFIQSGVMKPIEILKLREAVEESLRNDLVPELCQIAMEIIIVTKYPQTLKTPALIPVLKAKLSQTYVKLFSCIPQPKDDNINTLLFVCGYNIHWMLWKIAVEKREEMDLRFVFDCYHILVFSINGIFVSDSYVRVQIEKIFSSKFMEYERERKEKMMLRRLEKKRKANEKTFLGKKLHFTNLGAVEGGSEFAQSLTEKFKIKRGVALLQREEDLALKSENSKFNLHHMMTNPSNLTNNKKNSSQIEVISDDNKLMLQNVQFNVNQVSPSVQNVLQMTRMQLPFSRTKMLSHNFEKPDNKTEGILILLKEMTNQRKQKKDTNLSKKHQRNLIELYDLRMPGKEFFQKNTKVDPLFRDMLELNYVLRYQQESLAGLFSTKELHKHLQENPVVIGNVPNKSTTEPDVVQVVQHRHIEFNRPSTLLPTITEQQKEKVTENPKTKINVRNQFGKSQSVLSLKPKRDDDHCYVAKTNFYKTKYDKIISESTDNRIKQINQQLNSTNGRT